MNDRSSGQLIERDAKDSGNRHGDRKCGMRLACLVSPDLAPINTGGFGELRLREPDHGPAVTDHLCNVHAVRPQQV